MEKIVTHRVLHGHTEYLVKGLGYPASENTWEPQANICNRAFIDAYENRKKPRRTRAVNSIHMVKYPDDAPLPNPPPTAVRNATAQNTANHAWLLCHKLLLILLIFSFFTPLQCLNLLLLSIYLRLTKYNKIALVKNIARLIEVNIYTYNIKYKNSKNIKINNWENDG